MVLTGRRTCNDLGFQIVALHGVTRCDLASRPGCLVLSLHGIVAHMLAHVTKGARWHRRGL